MLAATGSIDVNAPPAHRFSRKDYHAMAEAGILTERDRVELIHGEIIAMMPIGPWHSAVSNRLNQSLNRLYGESAIVTMGNPLGLGEDSEAQPDVTVLRPKEDFYASAHPEAQDVLLLIEVADSSRAYDLGIKRDLYAAQGVEEFWVVDRKLRGIHVFRHPREGVYCESRVYSTNEHLPLPGCGGATLAAADTGV